MSGRKSVGHGHAESRRYRVARMSGRECVVFAFRRSGKTAYTPAGTLRGEGVAPPGEYLVGICLMTHVEYYPVIGSVKHIMQGHNLFYSAHA